MKNELYNESAAHFESYLDCVEYVTVSLGEFASDYDIDAIIDEAFDFVSDPDFIGFQCEKDEDEYWAIIEAHDISE